MRVVVILVILVIWVIVVVIWTVWMWYMVLAGRGEVGQRAAQIIRAPAPTNPGQPRRNHEGEESGEDIPEI